MKADLLIDGRRVAVEGEGETSLLDILREELDLVGAKPGCGIGRCGACVVLLDGMPVNACLVPRARLDGARVVTPEGLAEGTCDTILDVLRRHHIAQCGYCMNGLVVSLAWALGQPDPAIAVGEAVQGHLCRCGGLIALDRALPDLLAIAADAAS